VSGLQDLAGKVAVVTGGASGIGKGIAQALVAEGMRVVIADIEPGALDAAAAEIGAVGVRCDVASMQSVQALADTVRERFGTVHVVCNNAGVGSGAKVADMTTADWDWILAVNLKGVVHGVQSFLPILRANPDGGHMVNTASMSGLRVRPGAGGYAVTKFGIVALSETLALELEMEGSKVGVTVLCPGMVHTNIKSSLRNRPSGLPKGAFTDHDIAQTELGARMRWLESIDVGRIVVRAIRNGDLYAITHPEQVTEIEERHRRMEAAFRVAGEEQRGK
jgi:NAD(P)-dependent dehydrogenase (short-subunit alcohol dehydrogenase family)